MSPSSAGSWERAGDVIDLDRYMRGARPTRANHSEICSEQLVVDNGGVGGGGAGAGGGGLARYKQVSLDSGVSDGSYDARVFQRTRRASNTDRSRAPRDHVPARTPGALERSDSMRAFRTVCERALLEQQKQIARVEQFCERLAERSSERLKDPRRSESGRSSESSKRLGETGRSLKTQERLPERLPDRLSPERQVERPIEKLVERPIVPDRLSPERQSVRPIEKFVVRSAERVERPVEVSRRQQRGGSSETSDVTSSSRELWRKERQRSKECKTYKIIMSKLDDLSRRFSPRQSLPPRPRHPPRAPSSSSSVSVCDKLVATEPETNRAVRPTVQMQYQAAICVDAAPRPDGATESVAKCGSSGHFDLDDPLHLYSQAKRLQALNASTRGTTRSQSSGPQGAVRGQGQGQGGSCGEGGSESKKRPRSPSLCSLCRGYLRSLRQYIAAAFSQECECS